MSISSAAKQALHQAQTGRPETAEATIKRAVEIHGARALPHIITAWLDVLLARIDAPERLQADNSTAQRWAADLYAARRDDRDDLYEQILTSPEGPDQVGDCVMAVVRLVAHAINEAAI